MWIVIKNNKMVAKFYKEHEAEKFAHLHKGCKAEYVSFQAFKIKGVKLSRVLKRLDFLFIFYRVNLNKVII